VTAATPTHRGGKTFARPHAGGHGRGRPRVRAAKSQTALLDDVVAFAEHFDVSLLDWQREAFGAACERVDGRFRYRVAGISVPRGNGKS